MQLKDPFIQFIKKEPYFWDFCVANLGRETLLEIFNIEQAISEESLIITLQNSILDEEKRSLLADNLQEIGDQLNVENLIEIHIGFNTTTCTGGILVLPLDESKIITFYWLRSDFDEKSEILITDINPSYYCLKKTISLISKVNYYRECLENFEGMELWKSQIIWHSKFNLIEYFDTKKLLDTEMKNLIRKVQLF